MTRTTKTSKPIFLSVNPARTLIWACGFTREQAMDGARARSAPGAVETLEAGPKLAHALMRGGASMMTVRWAVDASGRAEILR